MTRPCTFFINTLLVAGNLGLFVVSGFFLLLLATDAWPHDAPMGWSYDYSCCSTNDCREVKTKAIKEDSRGFTIVATGELIPYGDTRIKESKDEFFHWCSVAGLDDSRSLCLYVPNRGI